MKTKVLSRDDLAAIVREMGVNTLMDGLIMRLHAFITTMGDNGSVDVRVRDGFCYEAPRTGLIEWMPVLRHESEVTIKVVGYHPRNPAALGLPTIIGSIGMFDVSHGGLRVLVDGSLPTTLRTAAASAVATRVLARPTSSTVGIIGAGAQGLTQAHAMMRTLPVERILYTDSDARALGSFSDRLRPIAEAGVAIEAASISEMLAACDVLCTATSLAVGAGPLFEDVPSTNPWLHVNAVGSDFPGKIELPRAMLQRALVCPDHREQCLLEGECQQLDPTALGPDLRTLVRGGEGYSSARDSLTVFDSTGWAVEDQVVCQYLVDCADEMGVGQELDFHYLTADPLNPYDVRFSD